MKNFFISYTSSDQEIAEWIAWIIEEAGYTTVIQAWDFSSGKIFPWEMHKASEECERTIAVLSPEYFKSRFTPVEWSAAFVKDPTGDYGKLIPIRACDFDVPGIFGAISYIDLVGLNENEAKQKLLSEIKLKRKKPIKIPLFNKIPKRPFPLSTIQVPFNHPVIGDIDELVGRVDDMAWLEDQLFLQDANCVAIASFHGASGMGKTFLSQAFANKHKSEHTFLPIYLGDTSPFNAGIQFLNRYGIDTSMIDTADKLISFLREFYSGGSGILVLDDVRSVDARLLIPDNTTAWRILITTRDSSLARELCGDRHIRQLDVLDISEAITLYKNVLGSAFNSDLVDDYTSLSRYLACRPYAIRLSAGYLLGALDASPAALLKRLHNKEKPGVDAHCSFELLDNLHGHCLSQLQTKSPEARDLLDCLAVCSDEGISLIHLLQWKSIKAEAYLQNAISLGLVIVEKHSGLVYMRLHTDLLRFLRNKDLLGKARDLSGYLKKALIDHAFSSVYDSSLQVHIGSLFHLFRSDGDILTLLFDDFYWHLYKTGSLHLAMDIASAYEGYCLEQRNKNSLQVSYGNQALILQAWGKLEEAMALHKKEEAICIELGNKDSLQISYGNQALILKAWGKLEEAMALLKKQEAICIELGNKDSLQASYGNQALILQAWGKLEEAMALHKKEEAICIELGNKDSLQVSYGNQALILQAWGKLEEAMALHKKQEAICIELGNKDSLQGTYGNQAGILYSRGKLEEAMALHKKEEAICIELGNKDSLQRTYGNQALILKAWGKLEEAMALHKKKEAICIELGNKNSLQISYGNQALILYSRGKLEEAMALHKKKEAICIELGNKDSLQISYGNQALILKAWGKLEEAEALLAKQRDVQSKIK
jgi:tetratricopeptide (TPR) repeat protein